MANTPRPTIVAMVHVHSNNALLNTSYSEAMKIAPYSSDDLKLIEYTRIRFSKSLKQLIKDTGLDMLQECRTAPLLFDDDLKSFVVNNFGKSEFVQQFVDRALSEVEILVNNGLDHVLIENVGAPYFIGDQIPVEDMAILYIVAKNIRDKYPKINIGIHVLSSDELESLPIAISCGAKFVRSESSIFSGFRPEGRTINRGNLAKFYYLRNYFQTKLLASLSEPGKQRWPAIWSDLQKKHTVFDQELSDIKIWLDNILFQKLEGIILTGAETGSDIAPGELETARLAIEKVKEQFRKYFGSEISIPIITGSGLDAQTYNKFADYIIVGSTLKHGGYWENNVSDKMVKKLLLRLGR